MKSSLLKITLASALSATSLLAEDGMKCCCMKAPDPKAEMQKKMEAKMKAADAEVNALLDQMNTATGDKKIDAMAALLNKMLQERKGMQEKMAAMHAKVAPEKKPEAEAAKPGAEPPKPEGHQH
jgi:hypothetical protein